jgi:hypothetical protein
MFANGDRRRQVRGHHHSSETGTPVVRPVRKAESLRQKVVRLPKRLAREVSLRVLHRSGGARAGTAIFVPPPKQGSVTAADMHSH